MIATLLRDDTLLTDVECPTWQNAVDLTGAPLIADGTIDATYLAAIKAAVHEYGSYMAIIDGVALFHGRPESSVHRVGLSLALLRNPVNLGDAPITASFILAAPDNESHVELMRELAVGLMDESFVNMLRTGGPRDEILREIHRLEHAHEEH